MDVQTLRRNLTEYIEDGNRSMSWFARQADVSHATVSRFIRGEQINLTEEVYGKLLNTLERLRSGEMENHTKLINMLEELIDELKADKKRLLGEVEALRRDNRAMMLDRRSDFMDEDQESLQSNGTTGNQEGG